MTTNNDHNTPVTLDDPRLTAYVLGDLDASEVVAIEDAIRMDASLRETVAGIQATCDMMASSLSHGVGEAPRLLPAQARERILSAAQLAPVGLEATALAAIRRRSASSFIGRTLRRAVGIAAMIGVAYLIGVAGWKDTHPQPSTTLVSSENGRLDNASWLQNIIITPEHRVEQLWTGPGLITVDDGKQAIPHATTFDGPRLVVPNHLWNSAVTLEQLAAEVPAGTYADDVNLDGVPKILSGGGAGGGNISGDGLPESLVGQAHDDGAFQGIDFDPVDATSSANAKSARPSGQPSGGTGAAPNPSVPAAPPTTAPSHKPAAKTASAPPKVSKDTEYALKAMGYIEDEGNDDSPPSSSASESSAKASAKAAKPALSKEMRDSLKSLGYIDASDPPANGPGKSKAKKGYNEAGQAKGKKAAAEKSAQAGKKSLAKADTEGKALSGLGYMEADDSDNADADDGAIADGSLHGRSEAGARSYGFTPKRARRDVDGSRFQAGNYFQGGYDTTDSLTDADLLVGGDGETSVDESGRTPDFLAQLDAETYAAVNDNPFTNVAEQPQSTFSIDTDSAGYSNIRRFLLSDQLPPPQAVRTEEMVNYFNYDYPLPQKGEPFSVTVEMSEAPWQPEHRLMRVGLKAFEVRKEDRPPVNLVFLVDNSGSMQDSSAKLPLVKESLKLLLEQLWAEDQVGIVTYTDKAKIALPSTPGSRFEDITRAIDSMTASGSTNGGAGLREAYAMARDNFIKDGVNRVMICTDGDFNVGETENSDLANLITEEAKSGVFLSVLGFGTGNLKDDKLEAIADKGNGHYAYIDDIIEARRVLGDQAGATLQTVAKDVKIQVEFNPAYVQSYRLIGYENRMLEAKDFADDKKDAGEIGAGHTVTALYEIVPAEGATGLTAKDAVAADATAGDGADGAPGEAVDDATAEVLIDAAATDPRFADTDFDPAAEDGDAEPSADDGGTLPDIDIEGRPEAYSYSHENGHLIASARYDTIHMAPPEIMTVRVRFKWPAEDVSNLMEVPVADGGLTLEEGSEDLRFAAAVAAFGMWLRHSPYAGDWSVDATAELAESGVGADESGYRREFVDLVRRTADLAAAVEAGAGRR